MSDLPVPPTAGDPCTPLTAVSTDGATVRACAHGGQVLGWTSAGSSADRLWTSPLARCGPTMAIRGGIPVIFPQFSSRGSLPRHGVARDRAWEMHAGTDHDGAARVDATLTDDPTTRELWPHAFRLTLQALARGHTLDVTLAVENEGATPLTFCAALHTYLRVRDTAEARIEGLGGHTAHDSADDVSPARLLPEALPAQGPVDLAVRGVGGPVRVVDPVTGTVEVTAEGFADRVLWNPGPAHGLADVPAGGASGFVCVEPASLTPLVLAPGATWQGGMRLEVPT